MKRVQIIGHITSEANAFVGLAREVTLDTTANNLRIHDGVTPGGHSIPNQAFNDNRYLAADSVQISVDTILEHTVDNGVNVDGVVLKDGLVDSVDVSAFATAYLAFIARTDNPHAVTKAQVGLATVTDNPQLKIASNLSDLNNVGTAQTNLGISPFVKTTLDDADAATFRTTIGALQASLISAYGLTLVDDANAAAARTTLGLGDIATQTAAAVAISGQVGTKYVSTAINRNVTIADDGAHIKYTVTGKDANLPSIASTVGMKVTIEASDAGITNINTNAAETIDGQNDLILYGIGNGTKSPDKITLQNDGTEWTIIAGKMTFGVQVNAAISATANNAHVKPRAPDFITTHLQCAIAQLGFAVGDYADIHGNGTTTLVQGSSNATTLYINMGTALPSVVNPTTQAVAVITAADWVAAVIGHWIY